MTENLVCYRMFIDSCKRLKIMKGSDAIGLGMYIFCMSTSNMVIIHKILMLIVSLDDGQLLRSLRGLFFGSGGGVGVGWMLKVKKIWKI